MAGTVQANFVTKTVTSTDGTAIYADATGSAGKPSLVFLHGLSLSGAVFE
jgi:pimeloyl-ACP methyl ester carboxylesterase